VKTGRRGVLLEKRRGLKWCPNSFLETETNLHGLQLRIFGAPMDF